MTDDRTWKDAFLSMSSYKKVVEGIAPDLQTRIELQLDIENGMHEEANLLFEVTELETEVFEKESHLRELCFESDAKFASENRQWALHQMKNQLTYCKLLKNINMEDNSIESEILECKVELQKVEELKNESEEAAAVRLLKRDKKQRQIDAIRINLENLEHALQLRYSTKKNEICQLETEIKELEELKRKKSINLNQSSETDTKVLEDESMDVVNERYHSMLKRMQVLHKHKLESMKQEIKGKFDTETRDYELRLEKQYAKKITKQVESVKLSKAKLDVEKEAFQLLQNKYNMRIELRRQLKELPKNQEPRIEEISKIRHSQQVIKHLWIDHPSLLKLSSETPGGHEQMAAAVLELMDCTILPLVKYPCDEIEQVYKQTADQLR